MIATRDRGFTLIELLVALFIAALMFAMGYGAINEALQNRGSIRRHQQNLVQLETAMAVMEQDFVQLAPRPVRQPIGDGYLACLQGQPMSDTSDTSNTSDASDTSDKSDKSDTSDTSDTSDASDTSASSDTPATSDSTDTSDSSDTAAPLVALTRNGWSNPIGLPRPELQRVAYVFDNGTLVREHWNVLDATLSSTPIKRNLLKRVISVRFRYMSPTHAWVDTWPPSPLVQGGENISASYYRMRPLAVEVILDTKQWGRIMRIFEIAQ